MKSLGSLLPFILETDDRYPQKRGGVVNLLAVHSKHSAPVMIAKIEMHIVNLSGIIIVR